MKTDAETLPQTIDVFVAYSARIVSVCTGGVVVQVWLLLAHPSGNVWHKFDPDDYPQVQNAYEDALEIAHVFGINRLEVDVVQLIEASSYPDDYA